MIRIFSEKTYFYLGAFFCAAILVIANNASAGGNIDSANPYAWSENTGWINFNPSQGGGVLVGDHAVTGYAWGENIGWITLNPSWGTGVQNDGYGHLSGYAWGENAGWINFAPSTTTPQRVVIDTSGNWSGYAWGENIGWISFNCSNTVSCGTVDFKISSGWKPPTVSASGSVSPVDAGSGGGTATFGATGLGSSTPPTDSGSGGGTPTTTPNPGGGGGSGGGVSFYLFRLYAGLYFVAYAFVDMLALLWKNFWFVIANIWNRLV